MDFREPSAAKSFQTEEEARGQKIPEPCGSSPFRREPALHGGFSRSAALFYKNIFVGKRDSILYNLAQVDGCNLALMNMG